MKTAKRFYALSDRFTGDYPREFTHGFANTKEVIFFDSMKAREEWLEETNLLTARSLTHSEAVHYSNKEKNGDRTARPARRPGVEVDYDDRSYDDVVIRASQSMY